jgi:hypothetical protein
MSTHTPKLSKQHLATLGSGWGLLGFVGVALALGGIVALATVASPDPRIALLLPFLLVGAYVFLVRIEWALLLLVFMVYTNLSDVMIETHGAPSVAWSTPTYRM